MSPIPRKQVRYCEGCREDRHVSHFIPDSPYCQMCREFGPAYSTEPGQPGGTKKGENMTIKGERHECDWCHKMVANLYSHKRFCKKRRVEGDPALAEGAPVQHAKKIRKVRGAKRRKAKAKAARRSSPARPESAPVNGCDDCPFRGLQTAIAQEQVAEAVRLGMKLLDAAGFVRRWGMTGDAHLTRAALILADHTG